MCSDFQTYSNNCKCTAKDDLCKLDVSFLDGVEKCVTLDGTLFASNYVGEIEFQKLERICVNKPLGTCVSAHLCFTMCVRSFEFTEIKRKSILVALNVVVKSSRTLLLMLIYVQYIHGIKIVFPSNPWCKQQ